MAESGFPGWLATHHVISHDPKDLNLLHVPEVKVPEQVLRESLGGGLKVMF